ncbi:hypothetical protein [Synechococcus sp. CS-205]|uniref:hypothetical protein n=1 Tax=Synechococcus sp. CS-205 TaxID=2847984 RepID=UPI00223AA5CD|nr:hypothetical protein [Synechococcus sp. CS-205]
MLTPEELQAELDGIPDPPDVSDLLDGSGVVETFNNVPCDQIDCEYVAGLLDQVQTWLDDAKDRMTELDDYTTRDDLERIRNEAQLGQRDGEQAGDDEAASAYQAIVDAANDKLQLANDRYNELAPQRSVEAETKGLLQSTHTHCCVESRWYHNYIN